MKSTFMIEQLDNKLIIQKKQLNILMSYLIYEVNWFQKSINAHLFGFETLIL